MRYLIISINLFLALGAWVSGITQWDPFLTEDDAHIALWFVPTVFAFLPFVIEYSRLGLNAEDGDPSYEQSLGKKRLLKKSVPHWNLWFFSPCAIAILLWLPFFRYMNPFFILIFGINLFSALWFAKLRTAALAVLKTEVESPREGG